MPAVLLTDDARRPVTLGLSKSPHLSARIGLAVVLGVTALLWFFRFNGPIDLRYDAGVYYVLGTSLAEGNGYRLANEPGAPRAIQYPPGLPLLVAAHQFVLGTSDPAVVGVWLKRTFAMLHLALAAGTFLLARAWLGGTAGLIAALLSVVQLNNYYLSNLLFTELPYTLVSVALGLVLLSQRLRERPMVREGVGFGLIGAGFALRTAGLALLAAWVGEAILRRHWRLAGVRALLAFLPFAGWQAYVRSVQQSPEYRHPAYAYQRAPYQFYNVSYAENLALLDPFQPELGPVDVRGVLARVGSNVAQLPVSLAEAASEVQGLWSGAAKTVFYPGRKQVPWLDNFAVVPLLAVAGVLVMGVIELWRRRNWFPVLLIACSVGLTCATPWPGQFSRYLAPIGPFLAIGLVLGAHRVGEAIRRVPGKQVRHLAWSAVGLVGLVFACAHAYAVMNSFRSMTRLAPVAVADEAWATRRWFYYDAAWADWDRAVDWIGRNTPREAVVATSAPHLCYLLTGRRAVFPPMEPDRPRANELLRAVPVSYVIVDEFEFLDVSRRYAAPAVKEAPADWKLVQRFNNTRVYERQPPHEGRNSLAGESRSIGSIGESPVGVSNLHGI